MSDPLYPELKSRLRLGADGLSLCAKVMSRLTLWRYFRVSSSCMAWAWVCAPIFSRAERSWIPTIVTPMGHAALPMAMPTYASAAAR